MKDKVRVWIHVTGDVGRSLVDFDGGETAIRIYYIINFLINNKKNPGYNKQPAQLSTKSKNRNCFL